MAFVRTILGDVQARGLGACDAHEHVVIALPQFATDDPSKEAADLLAFRDAGGGWVVDAMPGGAGRDAAMLAGLSRATGVRVVAATGLHLPAYYPPNADVLEMDADELADLFMREVEQMLDDADGRAGVVKVAGDEALSDHQREAFAAAAEANARTGVPILTHCEQGRGGEEQVGILADGGADLAKVTLSHCDRVADAEYHRDLLSSGVNLEYDGHFRGFDTVRLIAELIEQFPRQIVLGMDLARRSYWRGQGGSPGLAWLLTDLPSILMRAAVDAEAIDAMLVRNPARCFAFAGNAAEAFDAALEEAQQA